MKRPLTGPAPPPVVDSLHLSVTDRFSLRAEGRVTTTLVLIVILITLLMYTGVLGGRPHQETSSDTQRASEPPHSPPD